MSMTVGVGGGGGGDHDLMVGPVAEALGVSRSWLLERTSQLPETVDLPVSLLVELLNAADCLFDSEQQRNQKIQQWLSRISGRPLSEFDNCMSLLLALRRQFRLTRDEDLSDVTVWRRKEARPVVSKAQVEITIRPDNGSRLKKLAKQLGSPEAAIEFLLQMEEHCGKAGAQKRTRWPPKVIFESTRGQLKVDLGTEMVCVVLSQFKPDSTAAHTAPAAVPGAAQGPATDGAKPAEPALTGAARQQPESQFSGAGAQSAPSATSSVPLASGVENGYTSAPHHSTSASSQQQQPQQTVHSSADVPRLPLPVALPASFQTVELDATLPAQMFADDDCGECAAPAADGGGESGVVGGGGEAGVIAGDKTVVGAGGDSVSYTGGDSETVAVPASGGDANVSVMNENVVEDKSSTADVTAAVSSDSNIGKAGDEMVVDDSKSDSLSKSVSDDATPPEASASAPEDLENVPIKEAEISSQPAERDIESKADESESIKPGAPVVETPAGEEAADIPDAAPIESAQQSADELAAVHETVDTIDDQQMEPLYIAPSPGDPAGSTAPELVTEIGTTPADKGLIEGESTVSPSGVNADSMDVDEDVGSAALAPGEVDADAEMVPAASDVPMESTTDSSNA